METAITALIVIGVMILTIVGLTNSSLSAQAALMDASLALQEREGERIRTVLTATDTAVDPTGEFVQMTIHNAGSTLLSDFERWDAIVEYADGSTNHLLWLPYGTDPNQWSAAIFEDAATSLPEAFDPNLLNPGEDLVVTVRLSPVVGTGTTNRLTLVTPNGVTAAAAFTH